MPATAAAWWQRVHGPAVLCIAVVIAVAALHAAKPALAPVLLAALFALLLSSLVDRLQRLHIPRALGATLVILLLCGLFAGIVSATWAPASHWVAHAPETGRAIAQKIKPLQRWLAKLDVESQQAMASTQEPRRASAPATSATPSPTTAVLLGSPAVIVSIGSVILMTFFLLIAAPNVLARLEQRRAADTRTQSAIRLLNQVRAEVSGYLGMIALINVGLGVATGFAMWAWGMPTPVLWGTVAAALNFIPYIGSAVTLTLVTGVALVAFDGVGHAVGVAVTYVGLAAIEGQLVQPLLVGRRLDVNPLVIFLAVWFGSWLWGIVGIILAIPCLVALKATAEHLSSARSLADILDADRTPP